MRCPSCGATNPEAATWCGQCYRRFDEPARSDAPAAPADASGLVADSAGNGHVGDGTSALRAEPVAGPETAAPAGFRRAGDAIEWQCPQCATFNDMTLQHCAVCGTSFIDRFRTAQPVPERNWSAALLLSVVAPGAGHLSVGQHGTGWARLLLFVVWVMGALVVATSGGANAIVVATPLLLGAVIVWALSLVDVYRLSQGDSELLGGRTLLWLVVGVLLLLGISLFASVGGATPPPGAPTGG